MVKMNEYPIEISNQDKNPPQSHLEVELDRSNSVESLKEIHSDPFMAKIQKYFDRLMELDEKLSISSAKLDEYQLKDCWRLTNGCEYWIFDISLKRILTTYLFSSTMSHSIHEMPSFAHLLLLTVRIFFHHTLNARTVSQPNKTKERRRRKKNSKNYWNARNVMKYHLSISSHFHFRKKN